ncbi:MAG: hypothetical protein D6722_25035 [Bacteroidetes bacterium]|nr:MAG: hypothetical protein D6722_25035 [Bacteroidota bacterium]
MTPETVRYLTDQHDALWESRKADMRRWRASYLIDFWKKLPQRSNKIQIQTSDGYAHIESYQASLFSRNPAVVLKPGLQGLGDSHKAQAVCNMFLRKAREPIEGTSRLALIYPMAFLKLIPQDVPEVFSRVLPVSLPPWEVILDREAPTWSAQTYVGHVYHVSIEDARALWGRKVFNPMPKKDYLDELETDGDERLEGTKSLSAPADEAAFQYIRVTEMYDMKTGSLYLWSPGYSSGQDFIYKESIPFRSYDDSPVVPIAPFYYNRVPDRPLDGYSAMKRVYDQLYEKNVTRSFQANAVRKAARQWFARAGSLTDSAKALLAKGEDGAVIDVEIGLDESLSSIMAAVPHSPSRPEVEAYIGQVQRELDRGSVLAPFTRGEATKTTATEAAALAAYTSSEVGRLARERDAAISLLCMSFLCVLKTYIGEEESSALVMLEGTPTSVTASDLAGDFEIYPSDSSATPVADSVATQRLIDVAPLLVKLGSDPNVIRKEIVRKLHLSEELAAPASPGGPESAPRVPAPPEAPPTPDSVTANPTPSGVMSMIKGAG